MTKWTCPNCSAPWDGHSHDGFVAHPQTVMPDLVCECGHPLADHAESGWGPNTVCVEKLPDENDGWYGVCPCVRHGEALDGEHSGA